MDSPTTKPNADNTLSLLAEAYLRDTPRDNGSDSDSWDQHVDVHVDTPPASRAFPPRISDSSDSRSSTDGSKPAQQIISSPHTTLDQLEAQAKPPCYSPCKPTSASCCIATSLVAGVCVGLTGFLLYLRIENKGL